MGQGLNIVGITYDIGENLQNEKCYTWIHRDKQNYNEWKRNWRKERRERVNKNNRQSYQRNKLERRKQYLILRYGPNALKCLERDGMKCQKCFKDVELGKKIHGFAIHHLDWDKENNSLENLILLCGSCHMKLHKHVKDKFKIPKEFIEKETEEWFNPSKR